MLFIGSSVTDAAKAALSKLNIPFTVLCDSTTLSMPLCTHPDMSAISICGRLFSSGNVARFFSERGVECIDTGELPTSGYPNDVLFNGFALGNRLFCREKSFSSVVAAHARENGMEIVNVPQGYAKCSTLVLSDKKIITADKGIAKAAEPFCKVLLIKEGGIELSPYEYGFIGGASFVLDDTVYFFGDVTKHASAKEILMLLSSSGMKAVSLTNDILCDCGGAIIV